MRDRFTKYVTLYHLIPGNRPLLPRVTTLAAVSLKPFRREHLVQIVFDLVRINLSGNWSQFLLLQLLLKWVLNSITSNIGTPFLIKTLVCYQVPLLIFYTPYFP